MPPHRMPNPRHPRLHIQSFSTPFQSDENFLYKAFGGVPPQVLRSQKRAHGDSKATLMPTTVNHPSVSWRAARSSVIAKQQQNGNLSGEATTTTLNVCPNENSLSGKRKELEKEVNNLNKERRFVKRIKKKRWWRDDVIF
ncbi:hypothetical protein Rs2_47553 [Raphanus sativus]|nr:hypothetical protein Rs2_47553 [Raphanus sativus]